MFRIARRVAKDRVISTVDPDARHGHKTSARGFDGYKGHVAVDPDSELITATTVTAGNVGDGQAVEALLAEELAEPDASDPPEDESPAGPEEPLAVYGDSAYGAGSVLDTLEQADVEIMCKVQAPNAPGGRYAKDAFGIDLKAGTVTCPAGQTAGLRPIKNGHIAHFGDACRSCPLADRCTTSPGGRSIHVGLYEQQLTARSRAADRPGVEGRLHSDPPEGRAEDQSPDATPARRSPRPRPRAHQSRRRLHSAGCRGEPRATRDARCHPPRRWVGGQYRLTPLSGDSHPLSAPHRCARTRHGVSGPTKRAASPRPAVTERRPSRPLTARPHDAPTPRTSIYTNLLRASGGQSAYAPRRRAADRSLRHQLRRRASQEGLPYGRWAETLRGHFQLAVREIDTEGVDLGETGEIRWFPDRSFAGRTYIPAVARTTEGYELFGFVAFSESDRGPADFDSTADFTSETAEANPEWKIDLNNDVIGAWRGEQGKAADMTLVWGVALVPGGTVVTAELANLAVDQCELVEERFTLIAPDNYRGDFIEVKLWGRRGEELAVESLYVDDEDEDDSDEE